MSEDTRSLSSGPVMFGEYVWRMGRTRYDSNFVLTEIVKFSTSAPFKFTQVDNTLLPNSKARCLFLTDGLIILVTLDLRLIAGPCVKEVSSQGGIGVREEGQTCFFTAIDSIDLSMLTPPYEPNEPRTIPDTLK